MKRLLVSFGGGLLLLCLWIAIGVATSQDFDHEGPNSVWFSPIHAWGDFLRDIGWSQQVSRVSRLSPVPGFLLGITVLLGPFVLALSAVFHSITWLLRGMLLARKFK